MTLLKYYFIGIIIVMNITHTMNDSNKGGLELKQINVKMNDEIEHQQNNLTQNTTTIMRNNVISDSSIESSNYITALITTIIIRCRPRGIITDDIDEMSPGTGRKYTSTTAILPSESIELYSKSDEKRTETQKFGKEVVVPMNTLEMKPIFDEDICAICYNKFSWFPWQENAKGILKIKTDNKNHHIHEKILCKKCIKHMIQSKENCPYCREPIDIPENEDIHTLTISRRIRINMAFQNLVFVSIKQSRLFNAIKDSTLCNYMGTILMIPLYLIALPFIFLSMLIIQFIVFEDDTHDRRECVYFNRVIVGVILFFVLLGTSVEN
jgi:hypothetical protein